MMEKLINLGAAAELVGVSRSFLYHLVSARRVEHIRLGRKVLFSPAVLEHWIEQNTIEPIEGARQRRRR